MRSMFLEAPYVCSLQSDRMGFRLDGLAVTYGATSPDRLLSEATPPGAIQIPPDGQPIVLMADRQTTGGYPLIGMVTTADLSRMAQMAPGDELSFQAVSFEEARDLCCAQERLLRLLENGARM
jgi:antagonist of KipI